MKTHICALLIWTDAWFDGMLLPKGSVVFLNTWGLHMDEARYTEPDKFDPDRYMGKVLLANEYAVSSDYSTRDHYNYGKSPELRCEQWQTDPNIQALGADYVQEFIWPNATSS